MLRSPLAWAVAAGFTLAVSIVGFIGPVLATQQARLDGVFGVIAGFLVVILAPVITLLPRGVGAGHFSDWRQVAGRWLALFAFYGLLVGTTLTYVVVLAVYARPSTLDAGLIAAIYTGLLLVGATTIAIAILAGSLAQRRVVGLVSGVAGLAVIWFGGYVVGPVTQNRYQLYGLGMVSLRDTIFFLSLGAGALVVATPQVRSRPFPAAPLVLAVVLLVNVLAAREMPAIDLTQSGVNTLAPQSVSAAGHLKLDLRVVGFFRAGTGNGQAEADALVGLYQAQSAHVIYQRVNYDTSPRDVKAFSVREPNTLVLELGGKTQQLSPAMRSEQDFTAALLQLESGSTPLVCWAVGAGGRSLTDANQSSGYSGVASILAANNFATTDLSIDQVTSIPADCGQVALVGSTSELPQPAIKALDDYVAAGGNLLIAADPWNQNPAATASLSSALMPYGLAFSGALAVEPDPSRAFDVITPAILSYGSSPIARDVQGVASFFPQATAIAGTPTPATTAVVIGATSSRSYAIASPRQALQRQPGDSPGPFTIMETLQIGGGQKKARVVMIGTAGFAENRVLPPTSNDANLELALATFQWLAGQDALLGVPHKGARAVPLALTRQDQSVIIFLTAFLAPGLLLVAGLAVWWRRRATGLRPRFV